MYTRILLTDKLKASLHSHTDQSPHRNALQVELDTTEAIHTFRVCLGEEPVPWDGGLVRQGLQVAPRLLVHDA